MAHPGFRVRKQLRLLLCLLTVFPFPVMCALAIHKCGAGLAPSVRHHCVCLGSYNLPLVIGLCLESIQSGQQVSIAIVDPHTVLHLGCSEGKQWVIRNKEIGVFLPSIKVVHYQ